MGCILFASARGGYGTCHGNSPPYAVGSCRVCCYPSREGAWSCHEDHQQGKEEEWAVVEHRPQHLRRVDDIASARVPRVLYSAGLHLAACCQHKLLRATSVVCPAGAPGGANPETIRTREKRAQGCGRSEEALNIEGKAANAVPYHSEGLCHKQEPWPSTWPPLDPRSTWRSLLDSGFRVFEFGRGPSNVVKCASSVNSRVRVGATGRLTRPEGVQGGRGVGLVWVVLKRIRILLIPFDC